MQIDTENQRQSEIGDQIAQENGLLAKKGQRKVEALTASEDALRRSVDEKRDELESITDAVAQKKRRSPA